MYQNNVAVCDLLFQALVEARSLHSRFSPARSHSGDRADLVLAMALGLTAPG